MLDFIDILSIVTSIQLILFGIFLLLNKKNQVNLLLLSAFLFNNAVYIIGFIISGYALLYPKVLNYFLLWGTSAGYLFGPLLFLYTKSITQNNFIIKKTHLLHAIPFLVYIITSIIFFHSKSLDEKILLINSGSVLPVNVRFFLSLFMNIQIFIYMFLCLRVLLIHQQMIKEIYSEIERLKLSWLKLVLWAFILMWTLDFSYFVLSKLHFITSTLAFILSVFSIGINFAFAVVIMFKGMKQTKYFGDELKFQPGKIKYEKSTLGIEESQARLKSLLEYMNSNKPYLIPTLTITELAEKLNIHHKFLSQIINQNLNQNYYDFINDYRINEAKSLLTDPQKSSSTLLEILYEVGFNSKSVFNTVFKKNTGKTPTEYRKESLLKAG